MVVDAYMESASFYSKLVRLKVKNHVQLVQDEKEFLFQTGAIKSYNT